MKNILKTLTWYLLILAILFWQSSDAAIIGAPGWKAYSGTLSNSNQTWASEQGTILNFYSSAVLAYTFAAGEDFDVVAYWGHDYRGVGMVYGTNVSHNDFGTYSVDSYGPYFGALSTTGFASNYATTNGAEFYGQYHSPVPGYGSYTTPYYFRWNRTGNTLSLTYRESLVSGSWQNILAPITIASNQKVVIGLGEAYYTETAPLQLISFSAANAVPEMGNVYFLFLGILIALAYRRVM